MPLHTYYEGMMSSRDLYALRCAYLHSGMDNLDGQYAKDIVNRFQFVYSIHNNIIHCNRLSKKIDNNRYHILNLDIKEFGLEMIQAVKQFIILNNKSDDIKFNSKKLIELLNDKNGLIF